MGRLCSQINPVNNNSAFMAFSSGADVLSEERKLVIFSDDFNVFTNSKDVKELSWMPHRVVHF